MVNKKNMIIILCLISFLLSDNFKSGSINIITTNDIHGVIGEQDAYFMNPHFPPKIIGGSAYYKYLRELENHLPEKENDLLILDGGNFFQGHPLGIVDSGKTIIKWMNKIKYDAMVPGQYDFLFGYENLLNLSSIAEFPIIASNIFYSDNNQHVFKPYSIVEIQEVKIGIIGIASSNMNNLVLNKNIRGIYFSDEINAIEEWIPKVKDLGADVVVILSSLGIPWDRKKVYKKFLDNLNNEQNNYPLNSLSLGYYADGADLIISGGVSKGYRTPWYDRNSHVYIFQNYGNGTEFGHFLLKYDLVNKDFKGFDYVVKNSISQTLFIDDFSFDDKKYYWIKNEVSKAIEDVYNVNWYYKSTPDNDSFEEDDAKQNKKRYDEIQNRIDIFSENQINDKKINKWDIPNIDTDGIDVITWNCEFFPTAGDSTIEALSEIVADLNPDIIAFQEIKQRGWFDKMMKLLPDYNFVISQQSSFMDQAIIFKKNQFDFVKRIEIFAENDYNFAGRPPLQCDLIYKPSNKKLSIINLHMKCCDSGLPRRKKASQMLYDYLESKMTNSHKNYIVLGDWNDDLKDEEDEHCFMPFILDKNYIFPTYDITFDISQATYPKEPYVSFLDHILITTSLISENKSYDIKTLPIDKYMGGFNIYEQYISDHMPVLFSFK